MPIVRRRVSEGLGIRTDLNQDPMTAVAMGAAIFAEGRDWTAGEVVKSKPVRTAKRVSRLPLDFDFPLRSADRQVRVRVKVNNWAADDILI
jgi:molecular chaperone DnaK